MVETKEKIVDGLYRLFEDESNIKKRDEIHDAMYDLTFTNPKTPDNHKNWIGCKYNPESQTLTMFANTMFVNGGVRKFPSDLLKYVSEAFPDSNCNVNGSTYECKGIKPEDIINQ